jgi:hypothetical protein
MRAALILLVLLIALRAYAQESSGTYSAYGDVGEKHFKSTVSLEDVRRTPQWSPATDEARPLAPGRAQAIARKQLDRIVPPGSTWHLDAVRLVAAAEGTHWLYEVSFGREYPSEVAVTFAEHIDLLVLMDGTSPEPKAIPRPGLDHPNGT